jgi:2-octaprenyl-6-methoxyphenol hydroxylase
MKHDYDIIISGAGMVGLTMALAVARLGLKVAVIEKSLLPAQLDPHFDGRVSAIALGSKYIMEGIGAWEGMAPYAEPILDIRVTDGHTPVFLHYDHREVGDDPFGYIVENRYIRHALQTVVVQHADITVIQNAGLEGFRNEEGCAVCTIAGKGELRCALFIGAEGKQSPTRALAGIKITEWDYGQTAIVCTIAHEKSHQGLAQERFLPQGPFAVLPMQHNHSSLVWVEPTDRAPIYTELSDEECIQEITERVGDYLGKLSLVGKRFTYPLSLSHARAYIGERLALIGDAAHAMHPIAGQGVNVGFRDVAVLAELIGKQREAGLDIGAEDVLTHYQRWRRFDNVAMLGSTDGLNRLFTNNLIPIKLIRDFGLWAVGAAPPLKRFLMRHAMGLVGDLPKDIHPRNVN